MIPYTFYFKTFRVYLLPLVLVGCARSPDWSHRASGRQLGQLYLLHLFVVLVVHARQTGYIVRLAGHSDNSIYCPLFVLVVHARQTSPIVRLAINSDNSIYCTLFVLVVHARQTGPIVRLAGNSGLVERQLWRHQLDALATWG